MNSWLNVPNLLTLTRVLVIPVVFWLWVNGSYLEAAVCAALAATTDFFDGRLARSMNQTTYVGAILDPVADKFMVLFLFGLLAYAQIIPIWLFCFSLLRNISQLLSIPVLLWWKKIAFKVRPTFLPKFASGLSFAIIVMGLLVADSHRGEALPLIERALTFSTIILGILELQILFTYWPRFFQILYREQDTFE